MAVSLIQSSFQFGEVSTLLHAKVDSPIYYRAVKRLRNMLVIPQGGAQRRFGLDWIDDITATSDYREVLPYIFDYEDGTRYLLVFRHQAVDIYWSDNPLDLPVTVVTTYTASEIQDLCIAQSANLVFITHGSHVPGILRRTAAGSPPTFALEANPTFLNYPTFDFLQNYDGYTFKVQVGGVDIVIAQNLLGQVVEVVSSTAMFSADFVGGVFYGEGGVIRFTFMNSTTNMAGRIINIFSAESSLFHAGSGNAIHGNDCVVTEKAFSANRGYPQKVAFFQNRIFFAKTSTLLGGIWGSNYNGYNSTKLNFDDSATLDTNSISTVLQGNRSTIINHILGFKTLIVFTSSGLYSTPLLIDLPLTPTNIAFVNLQTADAASTVPPLVFDNETIFFDKGGKKVKTINVNATTQHYETKNISVLAPHLIDQPYSAAVFENSSVKDGNWMFVVNSGDTILDDDTAMEGTLSVYQNVPEQEIVAWSLMTTSETSDGSVGKFRHVVSDEERAYFIVEREINGNTVLYIEKLNFSTFMDCAKSGTQALSTTISGLSHLEGETVKVRGLEDGATRQAVVNTIGVVTGGVITLETAVTDYEVGLPWYPTIVPLPINVPTPIGANLYLPKSISALYVDFNESLGIEVNGELIPPFRFNDDVYDDGAQPKTDFVKMVPMVGWDPRAEITISQSEPLPLTLVGLGFEIKV